MNEDHRKFILASTSPRRRALLQQIGLPFEVVSSTYKEDMSLSLSPEELTAYLSLQKAHNVAEKYKESIIIAADTLVAIDNKVLGKAHTEEDARSMLKLLSGRKHAVVTGLTVIIPARAGSAARADIDGPNGSQISGGKLTQPLIENSAHSSDVYFKTLTPQEIEWYIATGEPLEKAGAYAIQERGGVFVEKIEGSYSNVVGLPLEKLYEILTTYQLFP